MIYPTFFFNHADCIRKIPNQIDTFERCILVRSHDYIPNDASSQTT